MADLVGGSLVSHLFRKDLPGNDLLGDVCAFVDDKVSEEED